MGKLTNVIAVAQEEEKKAVEAEVEEIQIRPDDVPADVWAIIQENGRLATERLNQILSSPKFMRYRPGDQAKLIALAQNRAYGNPKTNKVDNGMGKRGRALQNVTAAELNNLVARATLPEYKKSQQIEDAEIIDD